MGWANDPYTRAGSGPDSPPPQWAEPTVVDYPLYPDPAYAGEQQPYTAGYTVPGVPAPPPAPTGYWQPPPGEPPASRPPPPPEPPRTPRWLWLLTGATVLLVVGLVVALVITGTSDSDRTAVPPLTPTLTPSSPVPTAPQRPRVPPPPTRTSPGPTPPSPTSPAPPTSTPPPGATQAVSYQVSGSGKALSIAYIDSGGVLQTDFNVVLPWSMQVSLDASVSDAAMVTVITAGTQVTCSLSVDGEQVRRHSGAFLTICAAAG
ncbi:hypothetical protein H7J77_04400 [Mycolicibacillus parakoreensis]|uniref:MmpS family protein n=1 Tax=Mycolicibacillus parakoreensis TaxID=1069221 RepID=A0ABY3U1C8_9MYCO|nr:MmpS family transport accessory protein [Mycolicibacillus parakoreensis]MCV7314779.1 hypothetical protein [Mycolicibacillus parakoreensis]ULN53782.1 MmpS family protein [Mycolicibacillus parakoreensis]HLR98119.1 MmpS family transport accessory protein [Mycolicibacillus parakoreensis]